MAKVVGKVAEAEAATTHPGSSGPRTPTSPVIRGSGVRLAVGVGQPLPSRVRRLLAPVAEMQRE